MYVEYTRQTRQTLTDLSDRARSAMDLRLGPRTLQVSIEPLVSTERSESTFASPSARLRHSWSPCNPRRPVVAAGDAFACSDSQGRRYPPRAPARCGPRPSCANCHSRKGRGPTRLFRVPDESSRNFCRYREQTARGSGRHKQGVTLAYRPGSRRSPWTFRLFSALRLIFHTQKDPQQQNVKCPAVLGSQRVAMGHYDDGSDKYRQGKVHHLAGEPMYAPPFATDKAHSLVPQNLHRLLNAKSDGSAQGPEQEHSSAHQRNSNDELNADENRQTNISPAACHDTPGFVLRHEVCGIEDVDQRSPEQSNRPDGEVGGHITGALRFHGFDDWALAINKRKAKATRQNPADDGHHQAAQELPRPTLTPEHPFPAKTRAGDDNGPHQYNRHTEQYRATGRGPQIGCCAE